MIKELLKLLDYIHIQQLTHYMPNNLRGLKSLDLVREVTEELNKHTSLFDSDPWVYGTMLRLDIFFQKIVLFNYISQFTILEKTYHQNNSILNLEKHFEQTVNDGILRNFLHFHNKFTIQQLTLPSRKLDKKLATYGFVKKSIVLDINELNSLKVSLYQIPLLIASKTNLFEQLPWVQDHLWFLSQEIERFIHL
ncbi:hypothetical protein V757_11090 [Pelistega indica]|uniref:Uncharacterized protein n=1 Tax=Pelistega indica TaxID=1414851 RepID=V8FW12_9BURK|nr:MULTISPECIES: hypothetical protein [Pelistega]ETD67612.1 hypothetical protein V757_11090 [Pelistega indica]